MRNKKIGSIVTVVLLTMISLIWLVPLIWSIWAMIRPSRLVASFDFSLQFTLENIQYVFTVFPMATYAMNSILYVGSILCIQLITITLAAYAVARIDFIGRKLVLLLLMAQIIIPGEVLLLSNYLTLRDLQLLDTRLGVVIVSFGSAMGTLLLRQSYKSIPASLEEAAVLDGCNFAQTLWYIYIPSCKTAYLSFSIVSINWHWNAFLWPLIVINSPAKRSLPLGLALLTKTSVEAGPMWSAAAAATIIIMLPLLILFIFFQKQFIKSFLTSGLK